MPLNKPQDRKMPTEAKNTKAAFRVGGLMKKQTAMLLVFLLLLCCTVSCFTQPVFAAEPQSNVTRVGCFPLNGFYNFSNGQVTDGYGADYTKSLFEYAGMPYEYVVYPSWVEALQALSDNKIDMLAPAQHTPERDELYLFDSFPIGTEYGALLTLETNETLVYEDFSSFNGLQVGVVPSLVFLNDFMDYEKRNNFEVNLVYYKDTATLVAAMNAGDVDAALVNMMVKTDAMKLLARFGAAPIYYMFSAESGDLCEKINLAVDKLTSEHPELQSKLSSKYFSDFNNLPFTKQELDYIAGCGTLQVACEADNSPFSYWDENTETVSGVNRALLQKIAEMSGLKMSFTVIPSGVDEQAFVQENNIAIVPGAEATGEGMQNGVSYSQSYFTLYQYFIGKHNTDFNKDSSATVAYLRTWQNKMDGLQEAYPNFTFVPYDSVEDCIQAVHTGEADYHLNDRYSVARILAAPRHKDMEIYPYEVFASQPSFEVLLGGEDGALLTSILNKSISRISEVDKEKLIDDFTDKNGYRYTIGDFVYLYRTQILIAAFILAAIIAALVLNANAKRKIRKTIEEDEQKLRNITNNINGGVVVLNGDNGLKITYANNGFLEMIGCDRKQLEENGSYLTYVHPDDLGKVQEAIASDEHELSLQLKVLKTDGAYVPALFNCTVGAVKDGHKELYCVILDLTEQEKLTEQLRIDKTRTELILNCVDEVFYEVNLQDNTISTSNSFYEKFGWTLPDQLPNQRQDYIIKTWDTDAENLDKISASTRELMAKKETVSAIVKLRSKKEKRMVWCEIVQHPVMANDGTIASVIGLVRDVDTQISEREHLIEQARRDPLTGLYNKEAFETMVSETLAEMPEEPHAMLFLDLDHFKDVNDTLGHMKGDKVICEASDKLRVIFSNYDILARFGGDEFCVFVKNIPRDTLCRKLDWMIEKLHVEYHEPKGDVTITCSCGVAYTDKQVIDYKTLMKQADKALYQSKEAGRNRYTFFAQSE